MRVLVLAPYPLDRAPSQRFRWEQYIEPLKELGVSLEPSCFLSATGMEVIHAQGQWSEKARVTVRGTICRLRDAGRARRYDLVLVHRESAPLGPAWLERVLGAMKVPYVFDFDDAVYLGASSHANRRLSWLKLSGKAVPVVRGASLVIAGNRHLADWAVRHNDRVVVVPTTIDTRAFRPKPVPRAGLCVGWTGSPSTVQHLELLAPVLVDLQRERDIRLRVIGDPGYRMPGANIEVLPWRSATETDDLAGIDIGVMPLPDDEWARGKCGLKALSYMAMGIPTVLSPVGVNREIARDGAAVEARTPSEWAVALRELIDDEGLRERLGRAGRVRVENEYSVTATLPRWHHALRQAAEYPRDPES